MTKKRDRHRHRDAATHLLAKRKGQEFAPTNVGGVVSQ
jgi:hypothetical protein